MKSYIKFLSRNGLYTAIEAVGLAVSLAFVILTGTYVWQQYSIARQNPDRDRIFLYGAEGYRGLSYADKEDIDSSIPEAELTARYMIVQGEPAKVGQESFLVDATFVDPEFFEMFPQVARFVEGSSESFSDVSNVFISRSFANKISSDGKDPVGMTLEYFRTDNYVIAGIIEDFGQSIFTNADVIFNIKTPFIADSYGSYGHSSIGNIYTFMRVHPDTDIDALREKCAVLCNSTYIKYDWGHMTGVLVSLEDLFFDTQAYMTRHASRSMLHVLLAVVIALLLSAVFNYINLSSALTSKRAKEMATRRLLGEGQGELFLHNILESIGFTAACLVLALLIAELFEPVMNDLLRGEDTMNPIELSYRPLTLILYALGAAILGALVGLLPSIQSMRYQPIDVIKGTWRRRSKMVFSKVFIVIQNTLSVVLVAVALLMEAQLAHMINRPTNAETENLFRVIIGLGSEYSEPLADRFAALPCVKEVAHTSGVPGSCHVGTRFKIDENQEVAARVLLCDTTTFRLLNLQKVEDFNHPTLRSMWLSESLANKLNLCDSTEALILRRCGNLNNSRSEYIGGTYRDFPTGPASEEDIMPYTAVYVVPPEIININNTLLISTVDESAETRKALLRCYSDYMEELYGMPMEPEDGGFVKEIMRQGLKPAEDTIRLVEIFMFLAVLLSLLGLVAMSTWYAGQNTKSIAIRKVFGGTVWSETAGSVRGYMLMVLISCVLGVPVAVYIGGRYLENFAYRVTGWWWVCLAAVVLSLAVSLASVLWQTLRAARTNPANELKKE